jgi:hypothetical protein
VICSLVAALVLYKPNIIVISILIQLYYHTLYSLYNSICSSLIFPLPDLFVQTVFRNPNELKSYVLPNPERCNVPASAMLLSNDSIVVVDLNVPAAHVALHHWQPNTPDGQGTPFLFNHGRSAANSTSGALMRIFKGSASSTEDYEFPRAIAFAASAIRSSTVVAVTCDKEIITGDYFLLLFTFADFYTFV